MNRVALRWGYLYLVVLLLVSGLGLMAQKERMQLQDYRNRYAQLERDRAALLRDYEARLSNRAVARWAESQGMVPMSEGRWAE
ncbi:MULTISPECIES: hypothetical protein [Oceanithermus]|uniref:Cell division protein FtsL n=1 Tax=Oceanithermus profundus (strain DSM 14977 / NBRC 100410 / VKM B-2274 / 506) TaxID=670487 RepID=E4U8P3_OCEP5|nr:hypothetical protein [Oceanithermus profundus]ADR36723.1 hypothetical protein Ocepr_1266 [Oceanithermus profundus DSM 14977]